MSSRPIIVAHPPGEEPEPVVEDEPPEWVPPREWRLRPIDLIHCKRCALRGHVAGDPVKCTQPISLRLGEWPL